MIIPSLLLAGLESAVNRYLALDPATLARLAPLSGKVVALELRGLNLTFYMAPNAGGLQLLGDYAGLPDTVISGAPFSLARLGIARGERGALFKGDVQVRGDVEAGQRFEAVLREIDIDWEEQLSRLVGDVAAHQMGVALRGMRAWGAQGLDNLGRDAADYLQEESSQLPSREEVSEFLAAVDGVRSDADRLTARVKRIEAWLAPRDAS